VDPLDDRGRFVCGTRARATHRPDLSTTSTATPSRRSGLPMSESAPRTSRDEHLRARGDNDVETGVICVLTRFGLRSAVFLPLPRRDYRRVLSDIGESEVPGLLQSAFLVESPRACYSLSIWSDGTAGLKPAPSVSQAHQWSGVYAGSTCLSSEDFGRHLKGPGSEEPCDLGRRETSPRDT